MEWIVKWCDLAGTLQFTEWTKPSHSLQETWRVMRRQNWIFHKSLFYCQSAFYKAAARKTGRMQRFGLYPAKIFRAVVIPLTTVYPIPDLFVSFSLCSFFVFMFFLCIYVTSLWDISNPLFFLCIYVSSLWDISHTLCCLFVFIFLVHIYQSNSLLFVFIYISCPYIPVTLSVVCLYLYFLSLYISHTLVVKWNLLQPAWPRLCSSISISSLNNNSFFLSFVFL